MDRRTLFALLLTALVIVVTPMIFPSPRRPAVTSDTTQIAARDSIARTSAGASTSSAAPTATPRAAAPSVLPAREPSRQAPAARAETTVVRTERAIYSIVSPGGTPANVFLPEYHSQRPGTPRQTPVAIVDPQDRLLRLRLVSDRDTIALDTVAFRAAPQQREGRVIVQSLTSTSTMAPVTLTYRFPVDSFVTHLQGSVAPTPGTPSWRLLVTLPKRIRTEEADITDDTRHLAIGYKPRGADVSSVSFKQLDTVAARVDTGSIVWVAERNKYFVVAVVAEAVAGARDSAFRALVMRGEPHSGDATAAQATAVLPATDGRFALKVYAGPQSWDHLRKTAPDLENVNPYGGWIHGLVQPFTTIVMRMLLWMHHTLNVGYGWVLVIFGVVVRLLLWPLNQNAMRSSMKLQRIQPQLAELQKKYARDPEKQREAMMKLYQEHGMSPFTPVLGCLPMLLPMPILFALYFVFQNTIELRGVSFFWLPDLALRDPYFITPLFMGISMFVLSWIGMRGMPPSPQGKMMAYVMPVMFTVLFWNFASGLNLYYAVQNIAALPQQWLLARERTSKPAAPTPGKRDPGGGKGT
jgi:YidC/Oxa1 family membrane protein insertase